MSNVKAPLSTEYTENLSTGKKSRAKNVNINELLKIYSQTPQTSSKYLTFEGPPPISIPHFTLNGRHRPIYKDAMKEKRTMSTNYEENRFKIKTLSNTNEINKALSRVLIDFKEFKLDQQKKNSNDKKERFKLGKTYFNDTSRNEMFLDNCHGLDEKKSFDQKPAVHERSRGILKELNLGKRAVSMPEQKFTINNKLKKDENKIFPSTILKTSAQFHKRDMKKVKSLKFKDVEPSEKRKCSSIEKSYKTIEPNTEAKENYLQIKIPTSNSMSNYPNIKLDSSYRSDDLAQHYSNLISNINKDLLKNEKAPKRISLKDEPKKNLNENLNRAHSYGISSSSRNKSEYTTRAISSNRLSSGKKSTYESINNLNSNIADLFKPDFSNNGLKKKSHLQTNYDNEGCSNIEKLIINSIEPVDKTEKDEIELFGHYGKLLNNLEESEWKNEIPLKDYPLNLDPSPVIIVKKQSQKQIEQIQSLAIRYLKPPTPQIPGDIIIMQEASVLTDSAPPLIIRQQQLKTETPEPLIIREAPPQMPNYSRTNLNITLRGKKLSPPPRKVIIEKLPELPPKPCPVLIERWLPYDKVKRKVIFKPASPVSNQDQPKNYIIEWTPPNVCIKKEFKYLGVRDTNPGEYIKSFGHTLKDPSELPNFVKSLKLSDDGVLTAQSVSVVEDIESTNNSDNSKIYKTKPFQLKSEQEELKSRNEEIENILGEAHSSSGLEIAAAQVIQASQTFSSCTSSPAVKLAFNSVSFVALDDIITQIFEKVSFEGLISFEEAKQIFIRLNHNLNRKLNESEIQDLFCREVASKDENWMNLEEFKTLFLSFQF